MKIQKILFSILLLIVSTSLSFAQSVPPPFTVAFVDSDVSVVELGDASGVGLYMVSFELTADSGDVYLDLSTTLSSLNPVPGSGFSWSLNPIFLGSIGNSGSVVTSSGDTGFNSNFFEIEEGETEVFHFTVMIEPEVSGLYGISLDYINWTTSPDITADNFFDLQGFDTDVVFLEVTVPEPSTMALTALGISSLFFLRKKRPRLSP